MAQFYFLGQDDQNAMQCDFLGHVMPMASSTTLLDLFGQDDKNDMLHNFFRSWYVTDDGVSVT